MGRSLADTEIQPDEHAVRVREVADDLLDRFRQPSHERGHGQDLVAARELRVFQEIDDLDLVAAQQMLLADLLQILEGQNRLRRLSGDVEPELVGLPCRTSGPVSGLHGDRVLHDGSMASPFRRTAVRVEQRQSADSSSRTRAARSSAPCRGT